MRFVHLLSLMAGRLAWITGEGGFSWVLRRFAERCYVLERRTGFFFSSFLAAILYAQIDCQSLARDRKRNCIRKVVSCSLCLSYVYPKQQAYWCFHDQLRRIMYNIPSHLYDNQKLLHPV